MDFSLKLEFLLQSFKFLEFSFLTCRKFNLSCFSQPQNLLQAICHCLFVYCLLTLLLWIFICSDLALQVAAASKCFSLHNFTKHHVVVSQFITVFTPHRLAWDVLINFSLKLTTHCRLNLLFLHKAFPRDDFGLTISKLSSLMILRVSQHGFLGLQLSFRSLWLLVISCSFFLSHLDLFCTKFNYRTWPEFRLKVGSVTYFGIHFLEPAVIHLLLLIKKPMVLWRMECN